MAQENLKKRVKEFLDSSMLPKTVFCKKMGISTSYLYKWLGGSFNASEEVEQRFRDYLKDAKC